MGKKTFSASTKGQSGILRPHRLVSYAEPDSSDEESRRDVITSGRHDKCRLIKNRKKTNFAAMRQLCRKWVRVNLKRCDERLDRSRRYSAAVGKKENLAVPFRVDSVSSLADQPLQAEEKEREEQEEEEEEEEEMTSTVEYLDDDAMKAVAELSSFKVEPGTGDNRENLATYDPLELRKEVEAEAELNRSSANYDRRENSHEEANRESTKRVRFSSASLSYTPTPPNASPVYSATSSRGLDPNRMPLPLSVPSRSAVDRDQGLASKNDDDSPGCSHWNVTSADDSSSPSKNSKRATGSSSGVNQQYASTSRSEIGYPEDAPSSSTSSSSLNSLEPRVITMNQRFFTLLGFFCSYFSTLPSIRPLDHSFFILIIR